MFKVSTFITILYMCKKDDPYCIQALLYRLVFGYFSGMTYAFLTMTYLRNPGYLPKWLRAPVALDPEADPLQLVRVYNLRLWLANGIYSFEEYLQKSADGADIQNSQGDDTLDTVESHPNANPVDIEL